MSDHAEFWNKLARRYAAQPVADPAAFERKIAITKDRMTPQDTVLDVGCGTGTLALRLAPAGRHIHGLDFSSEMISIANGKASDQGIDNVTFHTGPFDEALSSFGPESLDGICACSFLHLVPDRRAVLDRAFRLLKPGGFFVSSTVCLGETWIPYKPILAIARWLGKAPMVKVLSIATVEDEIREAGFVDVTRPNVGSKPVVGFIVATKPSEPS